MTKQEAFSTIKKVVDLALQNGVIKSIEESKIVFDSLDTIYKSISTDEVKLQKVEADEEITK
jgi:hypothetical protein